MGESNRNARAAVAAGCAGLVAAFLGCSDTSGLVPGGSGTDAATETSTGDGSPADTWHPIVTDASPPDAASNDSGPREAAAVNDAMPQDATASMDATTLPDVSVNDATSGDTGSSDSASSPDSVRPDAGSMAAETSAPDASIPALQLCGLLDSDWGIATDAAACETATTSSCPDRQGNWLVSIVMNYAVALSGDCRISQMASPPVLTGMQSTDYVNSLAGFTLAFFGCPDPGGDAGAVTFGLVPEPLWSQVFTTTDLQVLSDLYVGAVAQSLSDQGANPLTAGQTDAINAKLQALAGTVPGAVTSSSYTYNTCVMDAGAEGAVDSNASLDGGADSSD